MSILVSFADEVAQSLPQPLKLPEEFRLALLWMEQNDCVRSVCGRDGRHASLFPRTLEAAPTSAIAVTAVDPRHVGDWTGSDGVAAAARLAPFIRTGGDGSMAALWLDDDGRQRFVHMGSGSGSVMMCVLADNAIDMLRLMAIGYDEICWPDNFALTPQEVFEEEAPGPCEQDERPPELLQPVEFRHFVETTFGVRVPERASDLVKRTASMDDSGSDDPFWRWIRSFDR